MSKLSDYFHAVATKTLSSVEVDPATSNQREFNGVKNLKRILGDSPDNNSFGCRFIYQNDDAEESLVHTGEVTWYDARKNHPTRSEFRLYYKPTPVMEVAREGDLFVFAKLADGSLAAIVAATGSTSAQKLRYIFGVGTEGTQGAFEFDETLGDTEVNFVKTEILEALGIEILERADDYLETMLTNFGGKFPNTYDFSSFARETCKSVESTNDPLGA